MTDLALLHDPATGTFDLAIEGGSLAADDGLTTAILISLFTDAPARADDTLPQAGADRRGWWGDGFNAGPDDSTGSRFWLLVREKLTEATAIKARDIFRDALSWLVDDQVVRELAIETELIRPDATHPSGALAIAISFTRPDGPARQRFDFVWSATTRSFAVT